jgi:hypothetical protein
MNNPLRASRSIPSCFHGVKRESRKRIVVLLLLSVLILNMCVFLQHSVLTNAYELSRGGQLIATFLRQVAGFNVSGDVDRSFGFGTPLSPGSHHSRTDAKIVVEKDGRVFDTITTLLDDKLWIFTSYDSVELPEEKNVSECLGIARLAITKYRVLFNASYTDELIEMLSEAITKQCLTVENSDALLNVTVNVNCSTPLDYESFTTVRWYKKIANQFVSDYQRISIIISKGGFLTGFCDYLGAYYVATTSMNVSEEQAASISRPFAEVYGEVQGQQIVWTTTSLQWISDRESQRGDDIAVYPAWCFEARYNETKLGAYGYKAWVWGDNGQIFWKGPMGFIGGGGETGNANNTGLWLFLGVVAIVIVVTCSGTYLRRRKGRREGSK